MLRTASSSIEWMEEYRIPKQVTAFYLEGGWSKAGPISDENQKNHIRLIQARMIIMRTTMMMMMIIIMRNTNLFIHFSLWFYRHSFVSELVRNKRMWWGIVDNFCGKKTNSWLHTTKATDTRNTCYVWLRWSKNGMSSWNPYYSNINKYNKK